MSMYPSQGKDVVGFLTKQPSPETVQNVGGPMTAGAARDFAEKLRQMGYTVRIVKHTKQEAKR